MLRGIVFILLTLLSVRGNKLIGFQYLESNGWRPLVRSDVVGKKSNLINENFAPSTHTISPNKDSYEEYYNQEAIKQIEPITFENIDTAKRWDEDLKKYTENNQINYHSSNHSQNGTGPRLSRKSNLDLDLSLNYIEPKSGSMSKNIYNVHEDTEDVDIENISTTPKSGYIYDCKPESTRGDSLTNILKDALAKNNIKSYDHLDNYVKSRQGRPLINFNDKYQNYPHWSNNVNNVPVDPIVALFFAKYGNCFRNVYKTAEKYDFYANHHPHQWLYTNQAKRNI